MSLPCEDGAVTGNNPIPGDGKHKVLLADEDRDELRELAGLVEAAGHEVVSLAI